MEKYTHLQLCDMAKPASETEETKLERALDAVKRALGNSDIVLSSKYEIFGQGSYANNTNVRNNSDVDINVCYTAAFYYDLPIGKTIKDYDFSGSSPYSFQLFKNDIERMLGLYFGQKNVVRKNKCIHIYENTYHSEIDVVPTWEHRQYGNSKNDYKKGVVLWSDSGDKICNYPKQHKENGVSKNINTSKRYKSLVRIMKNLNIKMNDSNYYLNKNITSFLLECLMFNYPSFKLNDATYDWNIILRNVIYYFWDKSKEESLEWQKWIENSELLWLMYNHKWGRKDVNEFMLKLWNFLCYS